jgi:hypothetical protein
MGTFPNVHEGLIQAEVSFANQNGPTEAFARRAALSGLMMISSLPISDKDPTTERRLMSYLPEPVQVPETVLPRL